MNATVKEEEAAPVNAYDHVPYESKPYGGSHPDHLATIAALFGVTGAPIKKCRVLELGCASGGNIIPMAYNLPGSEFVGVDFSQRQVADGEKQIAELGLKNIELKAMNILDVDSKLGKFDYIIVHGIFSWVPRDVQDKIISASKELLNENGLAYISYNTMPGWHLRGMIRDMMLYHTGRLTEPQARAQQARALLDFLSTSVPTENNAYGILLKSELTLLSQLPDDYLLHDHLEEQNHPIYFHEFAERAASQGLQFLGEAAFSMMLTTNFPPNVDEILKRVSDNQIVKTEQYMDFVRNRLFRQTILCHQSVNLNRNLGPNSVRPFYVSFMAKPSEQTIPAHTQDLQVFQTANGNQLNTSNPITKAALQHLTQVYPQSVQFDELVKIAREKLAPHFADLGSFDVSAQVLGSDFLSAYAFGVLNLKTEANPLVVEISEKPKASDLVRVQAKTQAWATNQLHEMINVEVFHRQLVALLDGTKNREQLIEGLAQLVTEGKLVVQKQGQSLKEGQALKDVLGQTLDAALNSLAKAGVLVG